MKRALYRALVPRGLRQKLFNMHVREIRESDARARRVLAESIPVVGLSPEYIRNLRVVLDRTALIAQMPRESVVALVGVSDPMVARQVQLVTDPHRLHLIESWSGRRGTQYMSQIAAMFAETMADGKVLVNSGAPLDELGRLPDNYLDWAFLNCGFSYEATYGLLEACRTKVKEGGIVAGSNYGTGSWVTNERFGVVEAVNRFCKVHQWEMCYLTHEVDRLLCYAIRRMGANQKGKEVENNPI